MSFKYELLVSILFIFDSLDSENKRPRIGVNSASALVNQMCPGLVYNVSDMIGPPHDPSFDVTVLYTVSLLLDLFTEQCLYSDATSTITNLHIISFLFCL